MVASDSGAWIAAVEQVTPPQKFQQSIEYPAYPIGRHDAGPKALRGIGSY
jgi:hypothetical protein